MKTTSSSMLRPLLFLLIITSISTKSTFSNAAEGFTTAATAEMRPAAGPPEIRLSMFNDARRRLGGFQTCGLCTCCGGAKGLCVLSPCCFEISCNIPNRPFGFCSFLPKACNCFGCHL